MDNNNSRSLTGAIRFLESLRAFAASKERPPQPAAYKWHGIHTHHKARHGKHMDNVRAARKARNKRR